MRPLAVPLLIALLPLSAMAILQFILPVLAPLLTAHAGRPAEDYGWLGGAMGLGSVAFFFTCHAVMPALGPVRLLLMGLVFAMAGVTLVLTGVWPLMILGGLLVGFGYGTTAPAGSQVLADFTPRSLWGTLFSLRMAAVPLGGMAAGLIASVLAPAYGWRAALHVVVCACAAAAVVLTLVPRRYNDSRPLVGAALRRLVAPGALTRPFRVVSGIDGLSSLAVASWFMACVHSCVTTFFVVYLVTAHAFPLSKAAALFALLQGTAIIGRILFGALADRFGSPVPVLKLLAPLAGSAAVALSLVEASWPLSWVMAVTIYCGTTVGTWNGLFLAEVARLAPPDAVGDATASVGVFAFLAYLLTPPVAGAGFATFGYPPVLRVVAAFSLAALTIYIWRDRHAARALADRR